MARRRIDMYEYRQIIVRLRMGASIRSIAKAGLASRSKTKVIYDIALQQGWLTATNELPSNDLLAAHFNKSFISPINKSSLLPYKERIEEWYKQGVQGSVIHAVLQRDHGFKGAYDSVQRYLRKLRDKNPKTTIILDFKPGECAQIDFGAGPKIVDERTGEVLKTWIFVMVLAWSRHMYAEIVLKQDIETWLGCHRRAFEWFNGIPKKTTIDNPKCAITKACYYDPVVQRSYAEYAEGYGFMISPCPPRDPQKKGRVESGVKYVKNNFVPLRLFRDIVDANKQLKAWLLETAGNRDHGTTRKKPLTLFETEKSFLMPLPNNPPVLAVWEKVTLHGDCHVMFQYCRYSAPYKLVKQQLWLRATETTVQIFKDHTLVAVHPRINKKGSRNTLEEHLPPNAIAYCMRDAQWCLESAKKIGQHCEQIIQKLLNDSIVDYLRAAQGIIGLQKKYGNARLDAACHRALVFQSVHYQTIKSILKQGLEYESLPEQDAFDALTESYTGGGRFCRNTSNLLQ